MALPKDPGSDNLTAEHKTSGYQTGAIGGLPTPTSPATKPVAYTSSTPSGSGGMPADFGSQGINVGGPVKNAKTPIIEAIERAASELGVPLDLALAIAYHESGLNPNAVGDGGTSFGLYQLHKGGELTSAGLTPQQAGDPYTNAKVALAVVASVYKAHPGWTYGQIAAAAQRPANRTAYAASIDSLHSHQGKDILAFYAGNAHPTTRPITNSTSSGSGGGGGGPSSVDPNAAVSIDTYGYIHDLAASEPELAKLMAKYAGVDLSSATAQQRLQADIQNSKWWKTHTASERAAEIQKAQDPATYARTAKDALPLLRQMANDYYVKMSDATLGKWAGDVAAGKISTDEFKDYIKQQAKSMFPAMASAIDRGVTVDQYVDPYRQHAASLLEKNPDTINMMNDPTYMKAIFAVDPKTKDRTSMSLADWDTYLRKTPDFAKTHQANQQAAAFGNTLLQTFGKISS